MADQIPESQPSQTLPAPLCGSEDMKPGDQLKGKLLAKLLTIEAKNEPVIRPGLRHDWDSLKFYTRINSSLANVEAVVMQCVGRVITDPALQSRKVHRKLKTYTDEELEEREKEDEKFLSKVIELTQKSRELTRTKRLANARLQDLASKDDSLSTEKKMREPEGFTEFIDGWVDDIDGRGDEAQELLEESWRLQRKESRRRRKLLRSSTKGLF
ncbi:uncharacterized protein N7483_010343 [Penicillium malachiteum]|uniref:uncharacterized protein n=1 Tax=Penicillium malachiteum TaxID=1324776 RepID=UPI002549AC60|nr:uncharacterized protein N7483_010343 [Penicillium malachiteum]KAJ5713162.1 hypothetical protein N7483_010343 [Penicillium malachiteum]